MKPFSILLVVLSLFTVQSPAGEPRIWSVNSLEEILKGDARGVSIRNTGAVTLAPDSTEVFDTGQPFVWSSALDGAGNFYLGTGGDGRIYRVAPDGTGTLLYDAAELNVSALAAAPDGSLFAGTSPDGKVYRIDRDGKASVYFEPGEKYIWSLAVMPNGRLAVGTGESGKIYRVSGADADPAASLLFDTSETHIISLASDDKGNLYAGTDSDGLVLRFSGDGKPFALLDSPLREIHELAVGPDGSVYALALSESASANEKKPEDKKEAPKTVTVEKKTGSPAPAPKEEKSVYDLSSAKSAVYRILPDGGHDIIWRSDDVAAFSIYAHLTGRGVLIGTADKGRIYSVNNEGNVTLTLQLDEEQVSTIRTDGSWLYATTSNQGKFFRFGGMAKKEGVYESSVLDAGTTAAWGTVWWNARGGISLQTRSGNTATPNESWSDWSGPLTDGSGTRIGSPNARFLQWRAVLRPGDAETVLNEVNVSFLPRNIPPEVLSIEILPANIGLVANPEVFVDPNITALGLDPAEFGIVIPPAVPRKVFQSGARSFQWKASDRNGDDLRYSVFYRQLGEQDFRLLRENLTEPFYTLDGPGLPDGRYVIMIRVSDAPSNPGQAALTGERISEPFDIDNAAPAVTVVGAPRIEGDSVRVVFEARESSSRIRRAEYSLNGGKWRPVFADDGLSDGRTERYTLDLELKETGPYTISIRVFDASGNAGTARAAFRR